MPDGAHHDVALHISVPRQLWQDTESYGYEDKDEELRVLGRFLVEEASAAVARLRERGAKGHLDVQTVEITLTDNAEATVVDDPEAHIP